MIDIDLVEKKIQDILIEHKVKLGYTLTFPMYKVLPEEVRLSLLILEKHKMKIAMTIENET